MAVPIVSGRSDEEHITSPGQAASSSDSDQDDVSEWQNRSQAWMASYELKVSRCIAHNRFPNGLFAVVSPPPPPAQASRRRPAASPVGQASAENHGQVDYTEHDTIIQDFADLDTPRKTRSAPHSQLYHAVLPKDLLKRPKTGSSHLDPSISISSHASTSKQHTPRSKSVSARGRNKHKEVVTITDYEKLSPRDRANRFPSVESFANFLNQAAAHARPSGHPNPKRCRTFLSGLDICYLLDITVRQKLHDSDRIRMQRLSEVGAKLHSKPQVGLTTHIVIGGEAENWKTCRKAICEVMTNPNELFSINRLIRGSVQGKNVANVIWVVNARWVERCMKSQSRALEIEYSIKPPESTHAKKSLADSETTSNRSTNSRSRTIPTTRTRAGIDHKSSGSSDHQDSSEEIEVSMTRASPPVLKPGPRPPSVVTVLQRDTQLAPLGEGREVKRRSAHRIF